MHLRAAAAVLILISPTIVSGQRFSFGFVGGTHLTRDFPISRSLYLDPTYPSGLTAFDLYSDTHSFIAGLTVEVALTQRFSFEANALHRNLRLERRFILPDGQRQEDGRSSIGTWEWPLLLKYRLPLGPVRPFLEAGPSFRTRHNPAPTEPSQFGGAVGAGAEFNVGRLRLSPRIRYTRWQYDGQYPRIATKRDQIEFLTAISYASSPASWRVRGRKIRLGVIAGAPLTGGFEIARAPGAQRIEEQGYIAGLLAEVELNRWLSIEVDGLYRPFRAVDVHDLGGGALFKDEFTVLTWELPALLKYRTRSFSGIQPIIEAGPSFRLSGNRNGYNPSPVGFTIGGGVETHFRGVKIGTVLRYTRWARDANPYRDRPGNFHPPQTKPDQVEFLVTFSF